MLSLSAAADAFGVVSESSTALRTAGGGGGGTAALLSVLTVPPFCCLVSVVISFSDTRLPTVTLPSSFLPFSSCDTGFTGGGAMLGDCLHEARNDRNHCGLRKQKSTADATRRDMPRSAMAEVVCAESG